MTNLTGQTRRLYREFKSFTRKKGESLIRFCEEVEWCRDDARLNKNFAKALAKAISLMADGSFSTWDKHTIQVLFNAHFPGSSEGDLDGLEVVDSGNFPNWALGSAVVNLTWL